MSARCAEACSRVPSLFFKEEMELSLIGLNAAGKTSLVNVIAVRAEQASRLIRQRGEACTRAHCPLRPAAPWAAGEV